MIILVKVTLQQIAKEKCGKSVSKANVQLARALNRNGGSQEGGGAS